MVTPARVLDSRDPTNLGLPGPFVSAVSQKLKITGSIPTSGGTATVVPAGATGVLLNVTAASPAAAGFISIRPGNAAGAPATSSLNVDAGKSVPNAVQVALPTTGANAGQIDITYDAYGTAGPATELLIDVVGYLTNTGLQELVEAAPIAKSAYADDVSPDPDGTPKVLVSLTIEAPVPGIIQMTSSTRVFNGPFSGVVSCWLSIGANSVADANRTTRRTVLSDSGSTVGQCSTSGALQVAAGTYVVNSVGDAVAGVDLKDSTFNALFIAGGTVTAAAVGAASDGPPKVEGTP